MKIMAKFNFLSLGIILVITLTVLGVGVVIINDILYRFEDRILRLELSNAGKAILQTLNRSGLRAAVLTAEELQGLLRQKEDLKTIRLYLVEAPDNRVVFHPDFPAGEKIAFDFIDQMFQRKDGSIEYTIHGVSYYAVFTTVFPLNWLIVVSLTKEEMLAKKTVFLRTVGGLTLLLLGINTLVVSLFVRRLRRRIWTALACVGRIEQGDLSARIPSITVRDEVGRLQEGINSMSARIEQRTLEQQQAEEVLKEKEGRIRRLVESNIIGIFFWELSGAITDANDAFLDIIGYSRQDLLLEKIHWVEMTPPEYLAADERATEELLQTGSNQPYEKEYIRKDGSRVPVLIGGAFFEESQEKGLAFVLDLSARKRDEEEIRRLNEELQKKVVQLIEAQEELVRKEKLSILGQLSGSVGHELRNPLGVMSNAVYFLKMVLTEADETTREYLGIIEKEIAISQRIITDLLDFARTKTPQRLAIHVRELVKQGTVRCEIPENVRLTVDIPETLPRILVDPMQIGQVLWNLVTNGIQAMPKGGVLRINARLMRNAECGIRNSKLKDGKFEIVNLQSSIESDAALRMPHSAFETDFVEISVSDTGEGISPENRKKLFQPLFTTKARGIGLGLVVCNNLVEVNGGRIEVDSRVGEGATFKVILPVEKGEQ